MDDKYDAYLSNMVNNIAKAREAAGMRRDDSFLTTLISNNPMNPETEAQQRELDELRRRVTALEDKLGL